MVVGVALIVVVYLAFTTGTYVVHYYQLRSDERELRQEIQQLDTDHEQLSAVREYLESDEYVEEVARRTLGLVRPGETLVIVSGTDPPVTPTPQTTTAPPFASGDDDWWKALFVPTPTASP
jgi:cell division protein FtsL